MAAGEPAGRRPASRPPFGYVKDEEATLFVYERRAISAVQQRSQAEGQPWAKRRQALEREQHAGNVGLARVCVVTNRQQLALPSEQHFLVRDEAWEPHRVDRRVVWE